MKIIQRIPHGALGYSPIMQSFDRLGYILPSGSQAALGYFFVTNLSDPNFYFLIGESKKMRLGKVRTEQGEGFNPALKDLVLSALSTASKPLKELHEGKTLGMVTLNPL